ncbi:cytochrome P450 [Crepidotus variabilis]|uniref:Cytochrome P450 n=1 Tax=Crepidotus variabilis TaxID=179855 RepID=A0A9P6JWT0_9AGAR|nr:cytochrome P450 [Crepidotus variabilis]
MPTEKEWLTFAKWGEIYGITIFQLSSETSLTVSFAGDICSVTVLGQPIVILNSAKSAIEMLDKKSAIYSDRPQLVMAGELCGWKNTLVLLPYADRFRRFRRLFHNLIGNAALVKRFYPAEEIEVRKYLRRLLAKPDDPATQVQKHAGSVILRVSHGYEVKETYDQFVDLADRATDQFSLATAPGAFLVDLVPALRHLPSWLPGTGFLKTAQDWSGTLFEMVERPHNFVKQQMAAGTAEVSFTSTLLERNQPTPDEELDIKWAAASLYSGGADTSTAALRALFLTLAKHPEVQKKAQEEIDAVVGGDRLPSYEDRERLPYINALIIELLRWHTVVPLAAPHRLMQDDVHEGYFIPKGTLIIPNVWKCSHDPRVYNEPFRFNPDRFLSSKDRAPEPDPRDFCFGFGRRICPGLHLADATLFITAVMTLAVFDISKCVENGVIIEPVHDYTTGTISHPTPFKCSVKPRSEQAVALIQSECN